MVKKVGKYEIGRTLGEGTFGKCAAADRRLPCQPHNLFRGATSLGSGSA